MGARAGPRIVEILKIIWSGLGVAMLLSGFAVRALDIISEEESGLTWLKHEDHSDSVALKEQFAAYRRQRLA